MKIKLLFVPLSIALSIIIAIWMTKPMADVLKESKTELEKTKKEFADLEDREKNLVQAISAYKNIEGDLTLINNSFPEEKKSDDLLAELIDEVKNSNLFLSSIQFSEVIKSENKNEESNIGPAEDILNEEDRESAEKNNPKTVKKYFFQDDSSSIEVDLELLSGYSDIKNFIANISKVNRYLKILSLNFTKAVSQKEEEQQQPDLGRLSTKIKVKAFFNEETIIKNVSQLASSPDYIMGNLLTGKISHEVIDNFKNYRTKEVFEFPFNMEGSGKDNPFIK